MKGKFSGWVHLPNTSMLGISGGSATSRVGLGLLWTETHFTDHSAICSKILLKINIIPIYMGSVYSLKQKAFSRL